MRLAVVPFPDPQFLHEVAGDVAVRTWEGVGDPPPWLDQTTFYVPRYLGGAQPLRAMASMPRLEVVQTLTAGVDDVWEHLPDGVVLCNARGVHDASTAELVVGLTIAALRGLPDFVRGQDVGEWRARPHEALADKRVLLVGYGSVGAAVDRRLAGFEVEVTRVARSARPGSDPVVQGFEDLGALLPDADVVVLTVPLTTETRGMVDAAFLAALHDGALLVNAARGPVVVTDALVAECASGRLLAALDVTDPEPLPPNHPLWRLPNVLISPHVGGNTSAFLPRARRLVAEQLRRYAAGEPLDHVMAPASFRVEG
ncbi:MAG TPA: 2-hydroxyacid dehydrogenase [Candidatus Limnocylindria bacterium]|nr:2-hydroxyacid dehydrogenase [Candidatus Limnocylindria bacterium]